MQLFIVITCPELASGWYSPVNFICVYFGNMAMSYDIGLVLQKYSRIQETTMMDGIRINDDDHPKKNRCQSTCLSSFYGLSRRLGHLYIVVSLS